MRVEETRRRKHSMTREMPARIIAIDYRAYSQPRLDRLIPRRERQAVRSLETRQIDSSRMLLPYGAVCLAGMLRGSICKKGS